ncbi:MAG: hypothetical protein K9L73_02370 [Spirochaetia bacterium]|nr:hypothetical protein [Spirochaetia bacterium]
MTVADANAIWYSYMDMTAPAEALSEFIRKTIEEELVQELNVLASYDATKKAIQDIIDMPDRLIDLFIQWCLQGHGTRSARMRSSHFDVLTDTELAAMERAVKDSYIQA